MSEQRFDPAAEFLLTMQWPNLFEPTGLPERFRCKGCGWQGPRHEREGHFNHHVGIRKRSETARRKRIEQQRIANLEKARAARTPA